MPCWSSRSRTRASPTTSNAKTPLYAAHGVREYWVINAATLMTTVHRRPSGDAYAFSDEIRPDRRLVPELVPELALTLATLSVD